MKSIIKKYLLSSIMIFIFGAQIDAQIATPEVLYHGYSDIHQVFVTDFDKDGIEDILTVFNRNHSTNARSGIYLYVARKNGQKLNHQVQKITDIPVALAWLADVNGDGREDIVSRIAATPDQPEGDYLTFLNQEGQFQEVEMDFTFFLNDTRLLDGFADLNNDGYDDVLYKQEGDPSFNDTLKVAINQNGQFNQFYTIAAEPGEYLVGDLNNDGLLDFAFEELISGQPPSRTLYSLIALGDMTYDKRFLDSDFFTLKHIFGIVDINGDGKNEIIIEDLKNDLFYAINRPEFPQTNWNDTFAVGISLGQLYDVDFDGDLDFHYRLLDTTYISENDGNGNFISNVTDLDYPGDVYLDSYNSDEGLLPRHYFNDFSTDIIYYDEPNYSIEEFRRSEFSMKSLDDVESFDINRDGYLDIVFACRFSDLIAYFPGLPNKNFGPLVEIAKNEFGAKSFSIADFNQDGIADLCISSIWDNNNFIRYGRMDGSYEEPQVLFEGLGFTRGEAVGDFDQDGYPDVIVGDYSDGVLRLRRNQMGIFQEVENFQINGTPIKLEAKDLDFDGDDDILVQTNGSLRWLRNNKGAFEPEQFLAPAVILEYFFIDIDEDGKDEIISSDEDYVYIYKWNGMAYEEWLSVLGNETNSYAHFAPFDYNGDGLMDLIVSLNINTVRLFQNINNETFEFDGILNERFDFSIRDMHKNTDYVLDLDGDGDYDWIYDYARKITLINNLQGDESIRGNVYWDENLDSLRNTEELVVPNARITAFNGLDEEYYAFSDDFGNFKFFLDPNQYILFATPPNECWESLVPEQILVDYSEDVVQNSINFRMENLGSDKPALTASITRQPTRCGFTVRYFLTLTNEGCRTFSGAGKFELDSRVPNYSNVSLSEYTTDGNTISFDISELEPGQRMRFDLLVEVPGVAFLGDQMEDNITAFDITNGEQIFSKNFYSEINCAYDPNDKLSSPDRTREYGDAYVLDETITYTIRFQNTGTDTAFNIRLADTLSELIDISTFRPVDASHDYNVLLNTQDRILEVFFDDILLPDSNVNYIGSNGFFTFQIEPIEMLPDFTPITNQAAIYFDFNPPIITNLVKNTYVSDLSLVVSTREIEDQLIDVFPNPSLGKFYIDSEIPIRNISMLDISGAEIPFQASNGLSQIEVKRSGIYFLKIQTNRSTIMRKVVIQKL